MPTIAVSRPFVCARCLRATWFANYGATTSRHVRRYANAAPQDHKSDGTRDGEENLSGRGRKETKHGSQGYEVKAEPKEEGALTRRLRGMSEEALESGEYGALNAVKEAGGFSDDLKAQLEQRIAGANFRSSEADLPGAASRHTRDLAAAQAWTGTESVHDASLRMLNDAHKPLQKGGSPKVPGLQPPRAVDTGHRRNKAGHGVRLANARDRSNVYANVKEDAELDATERETRFQLLKDRFDPHARTIVPGTISGIASLASQRIEDAIARGQFKNIPRGKGTNVVRDHNASSPFIDTTEYFLNKMIQKQEIVPPWIEKQQELTSAANKFRTQLRHDWKRHAARMISSKGGSLEDQFRRAEAYAKVELISNPPKNKHETHASVEEKGRRSHISISSEVKTATSSDDLSGAKIAVAEQITAEEIAFGSLPEKHLQDDVTLPIEETTSMPADSSPTPPVPPAAFPFRDPDWERSETPYFTLAIKELNDKARTYNLQAPELAKKPYFNLQRELNACYADIAPQLPGAILDRARAPPKRADTWDTSGDKSVLGSLMGGPVRVRDERREKQYGFRQFWKDLWQSGRVG